LEWEQFVKVDANFMRPAEVDHLLADPAKVRRELGWSPRVSFKELIRMMVEQDVHRLENGLSDYAAVTVANG
jgi:GDPmannose 4,6-dehydratase